MFTLRQRFLPFTNLKIWNNIEQSKLFLHFALN